MKNNNNNNNSMIIKSTIGTSGIDISKSLILSRI